LLEIAILFRAQKCASVKVAPGNSLLSDRARWRQQAKVRPEKKLIDIDLLVSGEKVDPLFRGI
jgi:hypothetical protein